MSVVSRAIIILLDAFSVTSAATIKRSCTSCGSVSINTELTEFPSICVDFKQPALVAEKILVSKGLCLADFDHCHVDDLTVDGCTIARRHSKTRGGINLYFSANQKKLLTSQSTIVLNKG
ncbi:hypothetical protein GQX74_000430 [Glossina fuscipes]|nr:hypothetical protein GQX74_000430 [Glossina fuscipes]